MYRVFPCIGSLIPTSIWRICKWFTGIIACCSRIDRKKRIETVYTLCHTILASWLTAPSKEMREKMLIQTVFLWNNHYSSTSKTRFLSPDRLKNRNDFSGTGNDIHRYIFDLWKIWILLFELKMLIELLNWCPFIFDGIKQPSNLLWQSKFQFSKYSSSIELNEFWF